MTDKTKAQRVALRVAEIPDRFSPEDQPEMMLVTRDELIAFIEAEFDDPPGDAGLLRERVADLEEALEAMRQLLIQAQEERDRLLAAAPADKPAETAPCNLEPTTGLFASHRCRVCGAMWRRHADGSWSLASSTCGKCCDNESMGSQVERLPADADAGTVDERERRIAEWMRRITAARFNNDTPAFDRAVLDVGAMLRDRDAEVARLREELGKAMFSVRRFCGGHVGVPGDACPMCEVERLTKERDEARAILNGPSYRKTFACPCCESILKLRPTPDGGVAVDVQKERDSGWEALERLRDKIGSMHSRYDIEFPLSMTTAVLKSIADDSNKALASRPGAGKEGAAS